MLGENGSVHIFVFYIYVSIYTVYLHLFLFYISCCITEESRAYMLCIRASRASSGSRSEVVVVVVEVVLISVII